MPPPENDPKRWSFRQRFLRLPSRSSSRSKSPASKALTTARSAAVSTTSVNTATVVAPDTRTSSALEECNRSAQAGSIGSVQQTSPTSILQDARNLLTAEEQDVLPADSSNGIDILDIAYKSADDLRKQNAEASVQWQYHGRTIYLRDETAKIFQFLGKFKSVGDVAVSADPVLAGLPWAGLQVFIEYALSESKRRDAIVAGLELALYESNRLRVYVDYHKRLSASHPEDGVRRPLMNLRESLVRWYAEVLRFLANAISLYRKSDLARLANALWDPFSRATFEEQCDRLCQRAEKDTSSCGRIVELESSLKTLDSIHSVHFAISRVQDAVDLSRLEVGHRAMHDSFEDGGLVQCLPDTRTDLLAAIDAWACDPNGKHIFWLCGKAGTGKSTISCTVAERLKMKQVSVASFFFKKGIESRSNARLLFPTIASQLADLIPGIRHSLAAALGEVSNLCHKHLKEQFDKLLKEPLQEAQLVNSLPKDLVVVIDALDECEASSIGTVLKLLSQIKSVTSVRLRIFVTSRPESPVKSGFRAVSGELHTDVRLEEVQTASIEHDIRVFYTFNFAQMQQNGALKVPHDWPGEISIQALVRLSVPLFIVAATIMRYVAERHTRKRLELMMEQGSNSFVTGFKATYLPILKQTLVHDNDFENVPIITEFKGVVGPLVLLYNPLSTSALATLLKLPIEDIETVLEPLHSVLMIPQIPGGGIDETKEVGLFHLSFRDFLVDDRLKDKNQFWIDELQTHNLLATRCINLLSSGVLKEDVCELGAPGTLRLEVPTSRIEEHLPTAVAYACRYWVHHVIAGEDAMTGDQGPVHQFLLNHFLHWTEAMGWLGKAADVIRQLAALKSRINVGSSAQSRKETKAEKSPGLVALIEDLSRFILMNRPIIDEAPLQTYMALIFTPSQSLTRQLFRSTLEQTFEKKLKVPEHWSNERLRLQIGAHVTSMDYSADGSTLVTGTSHGAVQLWSTETGEEILDLTKGRDLIGVRVVVISADGKKVVSYHERVSADLFQELVLWFTDTGEKVVLHSPGSFYSGMTSIAISGDGKTIASCWIDGPRHKGVKSREIFVDSGEDHRYHHRFSLDLAENNPPRILALSHDGTVLAVMGPPIGSLSLLDTASQSLETTLEIQLPGEHEWKIFFGREGNTLTALFQDGDLRYWDVNSGRELSVDESVVEMRHLKLLAQELVAFSWEDRFGVVAICPKSCTLARKSEYMVGLYDVSSGFTIPLPREQDTNTWSHMKDRILDVAYSPDGTFVASVGVDSQVAFWNTSSGTLSHAFEILTGAVVPYPDLNVLAPILGEEVRPRNMRLLENGTAGELDQMHPSHAREVAFSCDGNRIAIIASFVVCKRSARIRTDYYLLVWITATGELHSVSQLPNRSICLSFHPHGRILAIGGANGRVDTVSVDDGRTLNTVRQCSDEEDPGGKSALSVAFSPNGDLLASFLVDSGVTVWGTSDYSVVFCQGTVGRVGDLMSVREKFLRFSGDSTVVASHEGRFRVDTEVPESQASEEGLPLAVVNQSWIVLRGERFLFLPKEYWGRFFDARGSSLAIGRQDEKGLSLFDFAK